MSRMLLLASALALFLTTIACGAAATTARAPRWACPSPVPQPYGPDGPIKEIIRHTRPITDGGDWDETVYYAIWEQEYGALGGPPFASPTPYAMMGTNYTLGQRVELWPLHVLVEARSGPVIDAPGIAPNSQQLYLIAITWVNRALDPIAMDYRRVQLRAMTDQNGAMVSDGNWGVSSRAMQLAGIDDLPTTIPSGTSRVTVPIIAPLGEPEAVDITFLGDPSFNPAMPQPTVGLGTPTPMIPIVPTATPIGGNPYLRAPGENTITIQWSNAVWKAPGAQPCGDPGVLTDWSSSSTWGMPVPVVGVAAPAGSSRLIQLALNQVGKPYVWGAKGPERFDCSGLVSWAYAQIGIGIPQGTAGQWPQMTPAVPPNVFPGDLVFFDIAGKGQIDHVGMLVGDLNGDGRMDMVHAANPDLGVRVDYDIFDSPYYAPRVRGYRTAR